MTTKTYAGESAAPAREQRAAPAWPRWAYVSMAAIFWAGVVAQAFLVGAGIFVNGAWMRWHDILGHLLTSPIPLFPLLMLIMSFVGRLPSAVRWLSALLLVLATIQPVFLYLRGVQPMLGALHPVNALLLFVLPMYLIARTRRVMRAAKEEL